MCLRPRARRRPPIEDHEVRKRTVAVHSPSREPIAGEPVAYGQIFRREPPYSPYSCWCPEVTEEDCGNPAGSAEQVRLARTFEEWLFRFAEVQRCVFNTLESCALKSLRDFDNRPRQSLNLENLSFVPEARAPALCKCLCMKIRHENIGVRFHQTSQFGHRMLQSEDVTQCKRANHKVKAGSPKRKPQAIGLYQPASQGRLRV